MNEFKESQTRNVPIRVTFTLILERRVWEESRVWQRARNRAEKLRTGCCTETERVQVPLDLE